MSKIFPDAFATKLEKFAKNIINRRVSYNVKLTEPMQALLTFIYKLRLMQDSSMWEQSEHVEHLQKLFSEALPLDSTGMPIISDWETLDVAENFLALLKVITRETSPYPQQFSAVTLLGEASYQKLETHIQKFPRDIYIKNHAKKRLGNLITAFFIDKEEMPTELFKIEYTQLVTIILQHDTSSHNISISLDSSSSAVSQAIDLTSTVQKHLDIENSVNELLKLDYPEFVYVDTVYWFYRCKAQHTLIPSQFTSKLAAALGEFRTQHTRHLEKNKWRADASKGEAGILNTLALEIESAEGKGLLNRIHFLLDAVNIAIERHQKFIEAHNAKSNSPTSNGTTVKILATLQAKLQEIHAGCAIADPTLASFLRKHPINGVIKKPKNLEATYKSMHERAVYHEKMFQKPAKEPSPTSSSPTTPSSPSSTPSSPIAETLATSLPFIDRPLPTTTPPHSPPTSSLIPKPSALTIGTRTLL